MSFDVFGPAAPQCPGVPPFLQLLLECFNFPPFLVIFHREVRGSHALSCFVWERPCFSPEFCFTPSPRAVIGSFLNSFPYHQTLVIFPGYRRQLKPSSPGFFTGFSWWAIFFLRPGHLKSFYLFYVNPIFWVTRRFFPFPESFYFHRVFRPPTLELASVNSALRNALFQITFRVHAFLLFFFCLSSAFSPLFVLFLLVFRCLRSLRLA